MVDLKGRGHWLLAAGMLALGIPVLAQGGPESILPPGFGDAQPEPAQPPPKAPRPPSGSQVTAPKAPTPAQAAEAEIAAGAKALADEPNVANQSTNAVEAIAAKYDLPTTSRRSLTQIGPLTPVDGGFAPNAFGKTRGPFLAGLMRTSRAPFVSRWAGIMLRRALLSDTTTPSEINGADWVAERAWLLLRMGEADAARLLVQNVDTDQYTARLYAIAMQAQLATADPAGLCPLLPRALNFSEEPSWEMAQAICASFSADQGAASATLSRAQRRGTARGIDYRLAEKAVGAGPNSRRSVKIEWDGVDHLTSWRFGLATATNVEIPDALFQSVGPHVRAWEARAPTIALARRQVGVSVATRPRRVLRGCCADVFRAARPGPPTQEAQELQLATFCARPIPAKQVTNGSPPCAICGPVPPLIVRPKLRSASTTPCCPSFRARRPASCRRPLFQPRHPG